MPPTPQTPSAPTFPRISSRLPSSFTFLKFCTQILWGPQTPSHHPDAAPVCLRGPHITSYLLRPRRCDCESSQNHSLPSPSCISCDSRPNPSRACSSKPHPHPVLPLGSIPQTLPLGRGSPPSRSNTARDSGCGPWSPALLPAPYLTARGSNASTTAAHCARAAARPLIGLQFAEPPVRHGAPPRPEACWGL